jgi:hypothetical protein
MFVFFASSQGRLIDAYDWVVRLVTVTLSTLSPELGFIPLAVSHFL